MRKRIIAAVIALGLLGLSYGCGSKGNYQTKNGYENGIVSVQTR